MIDALNVLLLLAYVTCLLLYMLSLAFKHWPFVLKSTYNRELDRQKLVNAETELSKKIAKDLACRVADLETKLEASTHESKEKTQ